ncbi:hypothetical protein FGRMN_2309 [Fusarium graminum]|nr:hypothetical protein FGRMN_2309 [Fusarium graminum]
MSDHTRSQNMSFSRHDHDSLGSGDHIPHLVVDLRALRILLEVTAVNQATENDAVAEVDTEVDQSTQQSIQQQPFAFRSTGPSSSDTVEVEASTVYTPAHVPGTPVHVSPDIASSEVDSASFSSGHDGDEIESDIYTDHHAGGKPQKSAFQMRIEQVSKTRLSAFTSSALSFLTQTNVGHIERNHEDSGGQPPIRDQQKDDYATGSITNDIADVASCNASEGSSSDSSETSTADSRYPSTILRGQDEEEDLISFDVTLCYDTATLAPEGSDSAPVSEAGTGDMMIEVTKADQNKTAEPTEKAEVSELEAVPMVDPVAALDNFPSVETMSMDENHPLRIFQPESEAADTCFGCKNDCDVTKCPCGHGYCPGCLCYMVLASVHGKTSFPPTCCGHLIPVDANSSTFDREILQEFLVKKFRVDLKIPEPTLCKAPPVSAPSPPTEDTLRDQLARHMESLGKKLCHLCKKAINKDAVCPDCCYRCNQPRGSCKCPWWEERQLKHNESATAFRIYNPKAPAFRPIISQPGPRQIVRQARPFGGLFPNQNRAAGAEPRGINCRHVEMKKMGKPGPCFDCKVKLPGGGWYCLQCHYLLCEKCKTIRHG